MMNLLLRYLPFILEFFINGSFVLLYTLKITEKLSDERMLQIHLMGTDFLAWPACAVIFFQLLMSYAQAKSSDEFLRKKIFSIVVFFPMVISMGDLEFTFGLTCAHLLVSFFQLNFPKIKIPTFNFFKSFKPIKAKASSFSPAQLVLFSFLSLILIGTLFLMLPFATKSSQSISFIDALFMATSAACVTGLSTISVGNDLTLFGQMVLLLLIQVGGLGYMTLSSMMAIILGKSLAMKDRLIIQDMLDISNQSELLALVVDIIKYTVLIELWGGAALTFAFMLNGFDMAQSLYLGVFHSISAFCNAGFSLFDNSLENFSNSYFIQGIISILIILGGLGFVVLRDLKKSFLKHYSFNRLEIHSKIVISTTAILISLAAMLLFFSEFLGALDALTLPEKVMSSIFHSVTLRTAGFNSLPLSQFNTYSIFMMTLFMFIGAGPGSTAGGIKVTTFALLFRSIISTISGRVDVELFNRKIPPVLIVKATAITMISLIICCVLLFFLMVLEPQINYMSLYFEAVSASATVGLSLGITSTLSSWGKFMLIMLMYMGRTGPLTLLLAIASRKKAVDQFKLPDGRVLIG